jgi:hypothetical protein
MKMMEIYKFLGMVFGVGAAALVVFKWTDKVQDTDVNLIQQFDEFQQEEQQYREDALEFQKVMIESVKSNRQKLDSVMNRVDRNYRAIHGNRSVIIEQIKKDTSLTAEEVVELMRPLMSEELKKNGWMNYYDTE